LANVRQAIFLLLFCSGAFFSHGWSLKRAAMNKIKISMLAVGSMDEFEVTLESIESILDFEKQLGAPCSVKVSPDCFYEPLKTICHGLVMYGHIPYDNAGGDIITSPLRMLSFLQEQGYEVLLSPEYEACKQADEQPLTESLERAKAAYQAERGGLVY
jgi:hypothetical protein